MSFSENELKILSGIVIAVTVLLLLIAFDMYKKEKDRTPGGEYCVQIITPARNPKTGEVREFGTPCSVPEGWEVI